MDMQFYIPLIVVDNYDYNYYYTIIIIIDITSCHRLIREFSGVEIRLLPHNRTNKIETEFMSLVSFWFLEIKAELMDRSTLTTEWHGQNICFKE